MIRFTKDECGKIISADIVEDVFDSETTEVLRQISEGNSKLLDKNAVDRALDIRARAIDFECKQIRAMDTGEVKADLLRKVMGDDFDPYYMMREDERKKGERSRREAQKSGMFRRIDDKLTAWDKALLRKIKLNSLGWMFLWYALAINVFILMFLVSGILDIHYSRNIHIAEGQQIFMLSAFAFLVHNLFTGTLILFPGCDPEWDR